MNYQSFLTRWRMRRIVKTLDYATKQGLRPGVEGFAKALEATALMTQHGKKDMPVTVQCTRRELNEFVSYMTRLHVAKQSLLVRARIGLAVLFMSDKKLLGEAPEDLIAHEKMNTKSSSDDKVIQLHR